VTIDFDTIFRLKPENLDDFAGIAAGGSADKLATTDVIYALMTSLGLTPGLSAATYDPANIAQQVVGTTATQTVTNKTLTSPVINTGLSVADAATGRAVAAALKVPYILAQSYVAVTTPADTTEDTLATISVPANAMGPNGMLRITTQWSCTSNANNKTARIYFGGTKFTEPAAFTTGNSSALLTQIRNRNATNSQIAHCLVGSGWGTVAGTVVSSAIDTTAAQNIVITGQKAVSGDTLKLEGYTIEILVP
jgi:hypothetical protein